MPKLGFEETYAAIKEGVVARVVGREVVVVRGPDAISYLQGQCSQDLSPLAPGEGADALLLSPQGKLELYVRVLIGGPEEAYVEVEESFGEECRERLGRFKLRVKATLDLERWRCVEVRGPDARPSTASEPGDGRFVLPYRFGDLTGYDVLGADVEPDGALALGDDDAFEVARIESGVPRLRRELTERTIPQEAGIVGRTVSFTKGCYTGQELVARIDARGNRVPWHLCRVVFSSTGPTPVPGDTIVSGEREIGRLTSVAYSPGRHAPIALAFVRREVVPPASVEVIIGGERVAAEVLELP